MVPSPDAGAKVVVGVGAPLVSPRPRRLALVALSAALGACRHHPARRDHAPPDCPAPAVTGAAWRHTGSRVAAALGDPRHRAADVVAAAGAPVTLTGKFAYGKVDKDLEGEPIQVFVTDAGGCTARRLPDAVTDDDGRVAVAAALAPGVHRYWLAAPGDGTVATGAAWVLDRPTPAVVFDVDGTLTTDDGELLEDLLGGAADIRPGAAEVAARWAARGYLVVYLTGRPDLLRERTRAWLDAHHLPRGPLLTPARIADGLPTRASVGAYKREALRALIAAGVVVERAYGNAATDVCAYAEAGIAPARTYILGTPTPCDGHPLPNALATYVGHVADVDRQPAR